MHSASCITVAALAYHGTMSRFRFLTCRHYGLADSGECQANCCISCVLLKKENRSGSWQRHGLFYCWGPSCLYIKRVKHKLQSKIERAPFLVHNIAVGAAFKSTTMQCYGWINIIVSDTAPSTAILVRHIRLSIILASHQRRENII